MTSAPKEGIHNTAYKLLITWALMPTFFPFSVAEFYAPDKQLYHEVRETTMITQRCMHAGHMQLVIGSRLQKREFWRSPCIMGICRGRGMRST